MNTEQDIMDKLRGYLEEQELDDTAFFENPTYATAIIGVSEDGHFVYDYDRMVKFIMDKDGCSEEDAREHEDYETMNSLDVKDKVCPVVVFPISSF